jgi:hypothetical protein
MATQYPTIPPLRLLVRILLLAAGFLAAAPARATTDFGDIAVTPWGWGDKVGPAHGYRVFRFTITNRSATDPHQVKLAFPKENYGRLRCVTPSVRVKPGQTAEVVLRFPRMPFEGRGLKVVIDGKSQKDYVPFERNDYGNQYSNNPLVVLLSRAAQGPRHNLERNVNRVFLGDAGVEFHGPRQDPEIRQAIASWSQNIRWKHAAGDVQDQSTHWLDYSGFDAIVVTSGDLQQAAVRSALWKYVECGGALLILGPVKVPASWGQPQVLVGRWEGRETVDPMFGAGLVGAGVGPGPLPAATASMTGRVSLLSYHAGFGQCLVSVEPRSNRWTPPHWRHVVESWGKTSLPWRQPLTMAEAHGAFPVVNNLGIPARGLFVVMLLFAVVIGPVNLYVLTRKKRKIWLLWTVPVISILTSAGVLGYMFVSEGWHGHERTEGITFLDQASGRAATLGLVGYYTPLVPRDGLHFGPDTELTPVLEWSRNDKGEPRDYQSRSRSPTRTIDWSDGQHLASGWLTARVPAYFLLRKCEVRPERVTVKRGPGGALTLTNGLGADIRRFWWADAQGNIYTAADVPAGGQTALVRRGERVAPRRSLEGLRQAYERDWLRRSRDLTERPADYLRPGCYIADLDGAPFIEQGLRQAHSRKAYSVVYGILD